MQVAITKKLADVMAVKPAMVAEDSDPFFSWTANWTNTFDKHKEDMVVMINNATRFTVIIYGVKYNQFKNIAEKMTTAIRNTLRALNINENVIDEYLRQAGEISFCSNHDRKLTACVNRQCMTSAIFMGESVAKSVGGIKYDDSSGYIVSDSPVDCGKSSGECFYPLEKFLQCLDERIDKPLYQYHAFELLVTLDLGVYQAVRRLVVPANFNFSQLHKILQNVYRWSNCHLYDFTVFGSAKKTPLARLVPYEESLEYDELAILMEGHKLSEYLSKGKFILYTYDMGDSWEHKIELVREFENYDKESPYLLEASGQTPPEDVGGVFGFMDFREIMLDPKHPDYKETKEWAGYWSPDLSEWKARPRVIRV